MSRSVLLFDPFPAGHRLHFVLALARRLKREPEVEIVFAVHEWVAENAVRILGEDAPANARFVPLPAAEAEAERHLRGVLRGVRLAERLAREHGAGQVYLMYLDTFLTGLALRLFWPSRVRFSGLIFKIDTRLRLGGVKALAKAAVRWLMRSRRVPTIHTFDATDPGSHAKLVTVPDGVSPPETATPPADLPPAWLQRDVRFLLFGAISARKGIFELIAALGLIDDAALARCGVLVCGAFEDDSKAAYEQAVAELKAARPAVMFETLERFVSDEELWWLLNRASVVLAPYQRHVGSSGVLRWAAAAGRPVLTQDVETVGRETQAWGLGLAVDTTDPAALADGLGRFIAGEPGALGDPRRREAFAEAHSEDVFAGAVIRSLAQA